MIELSLIALVSACLGFTILLFGLDVPIEHYFGPDNQDMPNPLI